MNPHSTSVSMKGLFAIASNLVMVYLGLCIALRLCQTRLIFFPDSTIKSTPTDVNLPYEAVQLPIGQEIVYGWWIPAATPHAPVLLYLHGNSSNIGDLVGRADRFHQLGLSVLLIDYRGYGRSSGAFPSESTVYEDAGTAWVYLTQTRQIAPRHLFVYGQSLGGAIAIELAIHHPDLAGVIIESSFTSMRDMVNEIAPYRLFPINWILTQRFDSLAKVSRRSAAEGNALRVPILFIHGTADKTVPVQMSQTLFAAAPEPKQLLLVPGAGHSNTPKLGGTRYLETIRAFIDKYDARVSP